MNHFTLFKFSFSREIGSLASKVHLRIKMWLHHSMKYDIWNGQSILFFNFNFKFAFRTLSSVFNCIKYPGTNETCVFTVFKTAQLELFISTQQSRKIEKSYWLQVREKLKSVSKQSKQLGDYGLKKTKTASVGCHSTCEEWPKGSCQTNWLPSFVQESFFFFFFVYFS